MRPEVLREELEARGLVLLGVGRHQTKRELLIVYLHGHAGQWQDGSAKREIRSVPGVLAVTDSSQAPTILLVTVSLTEEQARGKDVTGAEGGPGDNLEP
jgi:hypothetical protein